MSVGGSTSDVPLMRLREASCHCASLMAPDDLVGRVPAVRPLAHFKGVE